VGGAGVARQVDAAAESVEVEIRKLDLKDRAALAKWIVESLDNRAVAEMPAEEALRRARAGIS